MSKKSIAKLKRTIQRNGGRAGKRNGMYGKKRPDVAVASRQRWADPEYRKRMVMRMKNGGAAKARAACSNGPTSIEKKMMNVLGEMDLTYNSEVMLGSHMCDFVVKPNVIVECDGDYWHSLPEQQVRDRKQTNMYEKFGFTVLRFTGSQIRNDIVACREEIGYAVGC